MKNLLKRVFCIAAAVFFLVMNFNVTSYAESEWPDAFDLGAQTLSMNAGSTQKVWMRAVIDYQYFVGEHTSKDTYVECSYKSGTEYITIHIGADEQVKNVFFYFYDQDLDRTKDYASIEVYVQNIKPALTDSSAEVLKTYAGNNAEFNAYYYYANYPDLQAAYGKNADALLAHYNAFGKNEKRVANKLN